MYRQSRDSITFWVFACFLIFYVGLTRGHFIASDELQVFQQTESIVEHGTLAISPMPNAVRGRDDKLYALYGIGQSALSIPLYLTGKAVAYALVRTGAESWRYTLAGKPILDTGQLMSGRVEIFFVDLFNAMAGAALMAAFFAFSRRLGTEPRWALAATLVLGLATHLAGFTSGHYQHVAEALFALSALYLLHEDRMAPALHTRLLAGATIWIMLCVRPSTMAFVPALAGYLAWNSWQRSGRRLRGVVGEAWPVLAGIAAGYLTVSAVNEIKNGEFSFPGSYAKLHPLDTPFLTGLFGFLFTPGQSVFLFSPPLILAPWWLASFLREHKPEGMAICAMALAYLVLYANAHTWHGQWCFGPRFLAPTLPLLMLPMGVWLQRLRAGRRVWVVPLVAAGIVMTALQLLVNFVTIFLRERYYQDTQYGYLYEPALSQIPAHVRALLAWDDAVDFWLLNIYRNQGAGRFWLVFLVLATGLGYCVKRLQAALEKTYEKQGMAACAAEKW